MLLAVVGFKLASIELIPGLPWDMLRDKGDGVPRITATVLADDSYARRGRRRRRAVIANGRHLHTFIRRTLHGSRIHGRHRLAVSRCLIRPSCFGTPPFHRPR